MTKPTLETDPAIAYLRRISSTCGLLPLLNEVTTEEREILDRAFDSIASTVNRAEAEIFRLREQITEPRSQADGWSEVIQ